MKRDEDVDRADLRASCRCSTFKWTIPKLPFARFEALEGAIKQPPLRPSLAFPRRTRFYARRRPRRPSTRGATSCRRRRLRTARHGSADALDALGEILRLDEAGGNIDAAGAVLETPTTNEDAAAAGGERH